MEAAWAKLPPAQVAVSPSIFELTYAPRSKTQAITFFNLSNRPMHARITLSNWTLDEKGDIKVIPPTPQSLDQWILITPLNFTVRPHDRQTIRFAVRSRVRPKPGEHRAMIWIDEVLPPNAPNKGVRAKFRFGIPVYLSVPPATAKGKLEGIKVHPLPGKVKVAFRCVNRGNIHDRMRGTISLWKAGTPLSREARDKILEEGESSKYLAAKTSIPTLPIFPKQKRTITATLKTPKRGGRYLLYIKGGFKGGAAFVKQRSVSAPPSR